MICIIPHKFLNQNIDRVRLIEKFIRFKLAYVNSKIYNYNPTALHKQGRLSYSRNTIDASVKQFLALGWARIENNHLILASKNELYKIALAQELRKLTLKGKRMCDRDRSKAKDLKRKLQSDIKPLFLEIPTSQTLSLTLQLNALRSLEKRRNHLARSGETKSKLRTKNKYSSRNSAKKNSLAIQPDGISYSIIAKVLKVSRTQAFRTIKRLSDMNEIKVFRRLPVFHGMCREALAFIPNSFVSKKGYVWSVPPNDYSFGL